MSKVAGRCALLSKDMFDWLGGMGAEVPPEGLTAKAFQQGTNHTERHRGLGRVLVSAQ